MLGESNIMGMQEDSKGSGKHTFSRNDVFEFHTGSIIMVTLILGLVSKSMDKLETVQANPEGVASNVCCTYSERRHQLYSGDMR